MENKDQNDPEKEKLEARAAQLDELAQEIKDENGEPFFDRGSFMDVILKSMNDEE